MKEGMRDLQSSSTAEEFYYGVKRKNIIDPSERMKSISYSATSTVGKLTNLLEGKINFPPQAIRAMQQMTRRHGG